MCQGTGGCSDPAPVDMENMFAFCVFIHPRCRISFINSSASGSDSDDEWKNCTGPIISMIIVTAVIISVLNKNNDRSNSCKTSVSTFNDLLSLHLTALQYYIFPPAATVPNQ